MQKQFLFFPCLTLLAFLVWPSVSGDVSAVSDKVLAQSIGASYGTDVNEKCVPDPDADDCTSVNGGTRLPGGSTNCKAGSATCTWCSQLWIEGSCATATGFSCSYADGSSCPGNCGLMFEQPCTMIVALWYCTGNAALKGNCDTSITDACFNSVVP